MQSNGIKQVAKNLEGIFQKNSPTILTGVAVAGLFSTVVLAVRATPKAILLMDEDAERRYSNGEVLKLYPEDIKLVTSSMLLTKKQIIQATWKCYIPAAAVGTATIACIIGANSINLRRNAALASVYSITEAAFKEYQAKVTETLGKGKEIKIRDEIAKDRIANNPVSNTEVIFTGKGEVLCLDAISGRYFKSDVQSIKRVENEQNRILRDEMYVSLNDVYYELGLKPTKLGDELGWNIDRGYIEFDFSSQITDEGTPCLVLDYTLSPKFKYGDY